VGGREGVGERGGEDMRMEKGVNREREGVVKEEKREIEGGRRVMRGKGRNDGRGGLETGKGEKRGG